MRFLFALPLTALSLLPAAPAASASPVTEVFSIAASGFTDLTGLSAPPADPVSLALSLTFDPASGDQLDEAAGVTLLRSTVPIAGGLAFDYDSANDVLTFGGAGLGGIGLAAGTGDVLIQVNAPYTGTAGLGLFAYTASGSPGVYESLSGTVSGTVAVPEPGSLAIALGGLVFLVRRRERGRSRA